MLTKQNIGKKIKDARQEKGISQGELGKSLTPTRSHAAISDIERGVTDVTITDLSSIALKLNKPLSYFTGSSVSMNNMRTSKNISQDEYKKSKKSVDEFDDFIDLLRSKNEL